MDKNLLIQKYNIYIYERVKDILNSGKNIDDFDYKSDLHKIFEYFSCIKLTQEYNVSFYEYNDIDPTFKEDKQMNRNDTGIDACNMIDTIVQCKLRQKSLTWGECSTFFGSVVYSDGDGKLKTRWDRLIITRNQESSLSDNLSEKRRFKHFTDKTYPRKELLSYCKELIENPPEHLKEEYTIEKRDYQEECIKMIDDMNNTNLIICLPTGTGKNFIIIHSLKPNMKYLIMVPRIILMEQIKDEIIKYHPRMKSKIQLIGDSNNKFNLEKDITICVFNSVDIVKEHIETFNKIFIDEAHHIIKPEIYKNEDDDDDENIIEIEEDKDSENENCDNKTFIQIIKEFSKMNNNIYLSATIDEHHGFKFYKRDIREMIEKGYLCDYTINIPIFQEDPTNLSVCKYLVKNYRNVIIYCNSQKNGKIINKIMNTIQKGCSEYIDCNTTKKKRNDIISRYKSGQIPFLVNVKILVEGFDAPITKGVCFMSLPSSNTTLIQIIGRSLRLHPEKKIANVILPFSKMEDEKAICNFMKVMAMNDSRISKSYKDKKLGGYFDIENIVDDEDKNKDIDEDINEAEIIKDIDIKYELIFDSIGRLKNNTEIWEKRLEDIKKYIDINKKLPSNSDKDNEIKILGRWLSTQKKNYKKKEQIMKNDIIYNKFTDFLEMYKDYFIPNIELWNNHFEKVVNYIKENNKIPSDKNKDKDIKLLGSWLTNQKTNYRLKNRIMKNDMIYNKFKNFLENYNKYLLSNEEVWYNNLEKVMQYIKENNKLPSSESKDIKILGNWLSIQKNNYKKCVKIMKNDIIYKKFKDFQETYKECFLSNEEVWNNNLEKVIQYINMNDKLPSPTDKTKEINILGQWLSSQKINYKKKEQIMKNDIIYNKFKVFLKTYNNYFLTNEKIWDNNLKKIIKYFTENYKFPSAADKNKEIQSLGHWLSQQKNSYTNRKHIMKNDIIYNKFKDFLETYKF
jgi:superfamily II DNA/RNA helicase